MKSENLNHRIKTLNNHKKEYILINCSFVVTHYGLIEHEL